MKWITVAALLAVVDLATCGHAMSPHFLAWLKQNYKPEEVAAFLRDDLITGSFGGGNVTKETKDRPIVFVHGLNNEAGNLWKVVRDMGNAGYPGQYFFATTWGRGVEKMNLNVAMKCGHVLHIRRFIEAVLKYTGFDKINVIGYSMGSPIARKAIMGGSCVDDRNVELGPSLQSRIHTYISVAGANQGSYLCMLPFFDICNPVTGLSCNSKFLADVNWFKNYESSYKSFNLASTADWVVGYMACGKKASEFAGAHEWKVDGKNHEQTEYDTADIQVQMLRESYAGQSKSRPVAKIAEEKTKKEVRRAPAPKKPVQKRAVPKAAPLKKKVPAKKAVPAKKPAPAKKAAPKKPAPTKKAAPKKSAPAKKPPPKNAPKPSAKKTEKKTAKH